MKRFPTLAAVLVAASMLSAPGVAADEVVSGDLTISHPTARPNLPNRPTAAYMKIQNAGDADDRLISATSPAFGKIELHTVLKDGDVMKMQQIVDVPVPAGEAAVLKAGGLHLMLFDAKELHKDGAMFPITLTFQQAGDVEIMVRVDRKAGRGHDHSGHGHNANTDDDGHKHGHKKDDHGGHKHGIKSE